jgi:hypothetical protein
MLRTKVVKKSDNSKRRSEFFTAIFEPRPLSSQFSLFERHRKAKMQSFGCHFCARLAELCAAQN